MNNIINFFGSSGFIVLVVGVVILVGLNLFEFFIDKKRIKEMEEYKTIDKKV